MENNLEALILAIEQLAEPTYFDWINLIISSLAVILSGLAIYFAILVPKNLASHRNRISLFEKRYEFYLRLLDLHSTFESLLSVSGHKKMAVLVSALEELKPDTVDNSVFIHEILTALDSPKYFFSFDITEPQYATFYHAVKKVLLVMREQDTMNPEEEVTGIFENLDFFYDTVQDFERYFYICPPK